MDDQQRVLLASLAFVATSGWGLAAYCARLLMRGELVPRRTHQDALDALNIKDEAILTRLDHIEVMQEEQGKSLHSFLSSMQRVFRAPSINQKDGS